MYEKSVLVGIQIFKAEDIKISDLQIITTVKSVEITWDTCAVCSPCECFFFFHFFRLHCHSETLNLRIILCATSEMFVEPHDPRSSESGRIPISFTKQQPLSSFENVNSSKLYFLTEPDLTLSRDNGLNLYFISWYCTSQDIV